MGWPRASVYDPAGQGWVLQYSAPLSVAVAVGLGFAAYHVMRRQRAAEAVASGGAVASEGQRRRPPRKVRPQPGESPTSPR